jgi:hypothetical protein
VVQDGAPSHAARPTITEMQNRGLHLLGHPSSSPDPNLAEHPIGKIKYNLMNRRERRPTSEREFRADIEWEWTTCPQEKLAHLCETFPRRLRATEVQLDTSQPEQFLEVVEIAVTLSVAK